jgi:hypothetical protein
MPPVRGAPVALRSSSCWMKGENFDSGLAGMDGWRIDECSGASSALMSC